MEKTFLAQGGGGLRNDRIKTLKTMSHSVPNPKNVVINAFLVMHGSAAGLDTLFFTSYDLAWSTGCWSVSTLQVGAQSS